MPCTDKLTLKCELLAVHLIKKLQKIIPRPFYKSSSSYYVRSVITNKLELEQPTDSSLYKLKILKSLSASKTNVFF